MTAVPILLAHAFLQTKTNELVASLEMAFVKFLNVATERQAAHSRRAALAAAPATGG
jgi:biopolymer transport protein ExbB